MGKGKASKAFEEVLSEAQADLQNAWKKAGKFTHSGIKGSERAAQLRTFLEKRLPGVYRVSKGQAIDNQDLRSTELDLVIYDGFKNSPLHQGEEHVLITAEALLAVIEVKSVLTADELETCFNAAGRLRELRPFGKKFVSARKGGASAEDGNPRCYYSVFAYESNLTAADWLPKEWARIVAASATTTHPLDYVDNIFVLGRGLIAPGWGSGKLATGHGDDVFHEYFMNLINFLGRENRRREPVDWQYYVRGRQPGWVKL